MREELPRAHLIELPQAGHLLNIERPAEFNEALLGFLAQHPE